MPRTPLASAQTNRQAIVDVLVGARQRTAQITDAIAALIAQQSLTALDAASFGQFNNPTGSNVCSIAALGTDLTSTETDSARLWSADDIGKSIDIQGAGPAGATLRTTIADFADPNHVIVADAASTTVTASETSAGGIAVWGDAADGELAADPQLATNGDPLQNVETPSAALAAALAAIPPYSVATYAATVTIDLADDQQQIVACTLTDDVIIATAHAAAGKNLTLILLASGGDRAVTWPAWRALGAALPTTVPSGKALVVSVTWISSADAGGIAIAAAEA